MTRNPTRKDDHESMAATGTTPTPKPWWAEGGDETCEHCGQVYWHELEVRCVECDHPGCPWCVGVERVGVGTTCAPCHEGESDRRAPGRPRTARGQREG
jgi:hypothetical protein